MARIRHINCPKCGGTLGASTMDRVVKCNYCGIWAMVDFPDFIPEYFVRPRLKEVDARRKIQAFLRDDDMPEGLIQKARFHSARLYFIPFHEMQGRRLGTMTTTEYKDTGPRKLTRHVDSYGPYGETVTSWSYEHTPAPKQKTMDTRVVMADFTRLEPATLLDEWGLEESDISEIRSDPAGMLQPMDRRRMEKYGKLYDPTIKPEQMINQLERRAETAWLDDKTEFAEIRIKRIYYPVWRVRYRFQGRLYGVSVDGVTGRIMAARAPQDDRYRVYWMLGTSAIVAFLVGKISRSVLVKMFLALLGTSSAGQTQALAAYMVVLGVIGLLLAVMVMGFGWDQFRYPGEIVVLGDKRTVEKINRPDRTIFDTAREVLARIIGDSFQLRRGRG
jgi:hypothetical protein